MTSKSRLGKGLGALFPALPGEPKTAHAEQQQLGVDLESEETTANKKAPQEKAAAAPEKVESHKSGTEQHSESTAPIHLGEIKRKTIPAMKDSIPAVHKSTTVEKPRAASALPCPVSVIWHTPVTCFSEQQHRDERFQENAAGSAFREHKGIRQGKG